MTVETASFLSQLDATYPASSDLKSEGDNHLRLIKSAVKATFPNLTAAAVTPSTTELNYVTGVTSAIQTQLNAEITARALADTTETNARIAADALKANLASPTFTGVVTVPTPSNTTDATNKTYVDALVTATAFSTALPGQTGNSGKLVTTDGTNASWSAIKTIGGASLLGSGDIVVSSAGGATETSSAVSITLTSASNRVQAVAMTASDKAVTLPDATTLSTGGALFVVKNTGALRFAVRNSIGGLIAILDAGQMAVFYLSNNSTAAGVWAAGDISVGSSLSTLYSGSATTANAVASTYISVTALTSTQAVVTYQGTSGFLQTCTLNVSGSVITFGAVLTVNAVASTNTSVAALSSTQAIVTYIGTANTLYTCTLNVSGTTITAGTILSGGAAAPWQTSVTMLSTTTALASYANSSGYPCAVVLTVSGTTVTAGSVLVVAPGVVMQQPYLSVVALSSTQAVLTYPDVTTAYLQTCTLNVSGTTITAGAIVNLASIAIQYVALAKLSSTQAIAAFYGTTGYLNVVVISVSGTTVTLGSTVIVNAVASTYISIAILQSNQAMVTYRGTSGYLQNARLSISGTVPTLKEVTTLNAVASNYTAIAALTASLAVVAYQGTSSYLQTMTIEVAA